MSERESEQRKSFIADPDELTRQYALSLGLEDTALDENGELILLYDSIVVRFFVERERQLIILSAPATNKGVPHDVAVYAILLELNLKGSADGDGSLGLDSDSGILFYTHAISLVGLDQDRFRAFVERSLGVIMAWRQVIESDDFSRLAEKSVVLRDLPGDDGIVPTRV
jgi:hypothetical protein